MERLIAEETRVVQGEPEEPEEAEPEVTMEEREVKEEATEEEEEEEEEVVGERPCTLAVFDTLLRDQQKQSTLPRAPTPSRAPTPNRAPTPSRAPTPTPAPSPALAPSPAPEERGCRFDDCEEEGEAGDMKLHYAG